MMITKYPKVTLLVVIFALVYNIEYIKSCSPDLGNGNKSLVTAYNFYLGCVFNPINPIKIQ